MMGAALQPSRQQPLTWASSGKKIFHASCTFWKKLEMGFSSAFLADLRELYTLN